MPLIRVPTTKTPNQEYTWCGLPLDGCAAYGTMRRADPRSPFFQSLDFVRCPPAKTVPSRIIAAPEFLALAANRAFGVQIVIATLEPVQFELERAVVVRASANAVLPELLHDLMGLFY